MPVMSDELFDPEELDAWMAEEEEEERKAAELLRTALAAARGAPPPDELTVAAQRLRAALGSGAGLVWVRAAAGLGDDVPDSDVELLTTLVAASISPLEETGLDAEEESLLLTLERADWLGAVVELVRSGAGTRAHAGDLVRAVYRCPEVESSPWGESEDDEITEAGFEIVTFAWLALEVIDDDDRLTPLGAWVLPRGLARAWGSDFDAP